MLYKFFSGATQTDVNLGPRDIFVKANSGLSDRAGEITVPGGADLSNYLRNPVVLEGHDPSKVIGNFAPQIRDSLQGIITFAPQGISALADEICGLYKAGVRRAVSIGFVPKKTEPIKGGGVRYVEWELLELSCVAIPCDASALVIARSHSKAGRVLSGANATKLQQAHDAAESCRALVADVLDGAGGDTDEAKARRRRDLDIINVNTPPPMTRSERMAAAREMEIWSLRNAP
jgi:hypothetical protein